MSDGVRMRVLAPAKVNLGLFVGARRANGRHGLATVYESVSLADELVVETLAPGQDDVVDCPGVVGENLVARALGELRAAGWDGPPLHVMVTKRIPVAAGMGGGSADAAALLRLAQALVPGAVPAAVVEGIAQGLGADVLGQLESGVSLGVGEGEIVTRYGALAEHAFVVVPSTAALSTAAVYGEHDRLGLGRDADELERCRHELNLALAARPRAAWADQLLVNDLQAAAVSLCAPIDDTLAAVRLTSADLALVSGSGPTVLGIWWGQGAAEAAQSAALALVDRHPGTCAATPVGAEFGAPDVL